MQHFEQEIAARSSVNGVLADSRRDVLATSIGNQRLENQIGRRRQNDNMNSVDAISGRRIFEAVPLPGNEIPYLINTFNIQSK